MNNLLKKPADILYGVSRAKAIYQKKNPKEKILAADACKGIKSEEEQQLQKSLKWITSKRTVIILSEQQIKCGKSL